MNTPLRTSRRVVIEGIDGTGKSTTAHEAALQLSDAYPDTPIRVADSNGVSSFRGGERTHQAASWLIDLEPTAEQSKLRALGQLGVFTAVRQLTEAAGYRPNTLTIGVRDPFRVDPAVYAGIYGLNKIGDISPQARLKLFNTLAVAPHPDAIIHLIGDTETAHSNTHERDMVCSHETREAMGKIACELTDVLGAYEQLYGSPVTTVDALTPTTTSDAAATIEPLLPSSRKVYAVPLLTIPQPGEVTTAQSSADSRRIA